MNYQIMKRLSFLMLNEKPPAQLNDLLEFASPGSTLFM
jgi:hypothetical protein